MPSTASFRAHRLRPAAAALATLAVAGATLAGASPALAAPGDSGDLKVHRAGVPHWNTQDDLKVCKFSLSAFNFETVPLLTWAIAPQPPTPTGPTLSGSLTLIAGRGHTPEYSLPEGDYRLTWTFTGGVAKQKIFTVTCPDAKRGTPGARGERPDNGDGNGNEDRTAAAGQDDKWEQPSGAVPAGGGGMSGTGGDDGSGVGATPVVAGTLLAGLAGLIVVRRARRRVHGAA
ncbi:hypothetical protein [Streptomyces genisteinicus]|uniref:LPXTG cell wall anchor domain-containing protein n=1 Tax=Streptomyces genisteinicus TaxID=2768068 RepID=A0A7H0HPS1_9ACTN|nr:hypothetical protein [Streptomyces genisteinicus]QNP62537.1 hypothetical protein IAG43_06025 [Streptomyces genisteinicus]